jgi:superfamily II DNA or RNA helicase
MKFAVSPDGDRIQALEYTEREYTLLTYYFTRKVEDYWKLKTAAKKKGYTWAGWDGTIQFLSETGSIPIGLWNELRQFGIECEIEIEVEGLEELFDDISPDYVKSFIEENVTSRLGYELREYQYIGVHRLLRYKRGLLEIATSGGKTFMLYCFWLYLKKHNLCNKLLIVVPSTSLVNQMYGDFSEYHNHKESELKMARWYSGMDTYKSDSDILVTTYQTLVNKSENLYELFDVIAVDEAHTVNTNSLKKILKNCFDKKYVVGVSGTIITIDNKKTATTFNLQKYVGPIVSKISAKFLIDKGYSSPVKIKCLVLDYMSLKMKSDLATLKLLRKNTDASKVYGMEKSLILESEVRLGFIAKLGANFKGNGIIFFNNVKDKYGLRIYQEIKQLTNKKIVYYIDGETHMSTRQHIIEQMELGDDKVLVASYGTFSTGINIKNLHNLVLGESYKSEIKIVQAIGRGLRKIEGKKNVILFDIVDNFATSVVNPENGENKYVQNYMLSHFTKRKAIYASQGYDIEVLKIKL